MKLRLDDKAVRALEAPARGNRIDYDVPTARGDYVRGFAVRTTAAGRKTFLIVYVTRDGAERRHVIGDFGPHTVTTAREEARKLRVKVDAGRDPFAEQQESRANAEQRRQRARATVGGLCEGYIAMLREQGKASADKVEGDLFRHVRMEHPAVWNKGAADATLDDFVPVVAKLTKAGKARTAGKIRAYLRAAYAAAIASKGDPAIAEHFAGFDIKANPVRDLAPVNAPAKPNRKRALSVAELRAYWSVIKALPAPTGPLLRAHLLTGAQRLEQLCRATTADHDHDDRVLVLWDGKGRRRQPRRHLVPLVPDAEAALEAMIVADDDGKRERLGPYLFTVSNGKQATTYHTVRGYVLDVAEAMVEAKTASATFTPGELRKTIETRLAAAGIAKDHRAHLQSHGLGGVQDVHYDDHSYLDEKRAALEKLRTLLEPEAKVVPFKKSGTRR